MLKLSKYLLGKNKCKITWPLFNYFIKEEENDIKNEIIEQEKLLPKKMKNNINKKENKKPETIILSKSQRKSYNRTFLRFNNFSCRHDSFFFLYSFIIYPTMKNIKNDPILNIYNKIANSILTSTTEELNKGIWNILSNNKNQYIDLTSEGFKKYYTVLQDIQFLKNKPEFCIKYKKLKGCSSINCSKEYIITEYFSPCINFSDEYIIQYNIPTLIDLLFTNTNNFCTKCQWKDGKIISDESPKYFKIYSNIELPEFIFISFESELNEEFEIFPNVDLSIKEHDNLLYNKLISYFKYIEYILDNDFDIYNFKYEIKGIIAQPKVGHYCGIIINVDEPSFLIEKGKSYFYDDNLDNNEIKECYNWKDWIKKNIPIIGLYKKIK